MVREFALAERRQRLRRAAIGADTPQRPASPPEDDGAVVQPDTGTPRTARDPVQDRNRIAAGQRDLLQRVVDAVGRAEERHPSPVGREERLCGVLGARQRAYRHAVERPHEQTPLPIVRRAGRGSRRRTRSSCRLPKWPSSGRESSRTRQGSPAADTIERRCGAGAAGRASSHCPAAPASTSASAAAAQPMRPRHETRAGATVAACSPECVDSPSSANARSRADWKRDAGCFSRHRPTMRASAGGTCSAGSISGRLRAQDGRHHVGRRLAGERPAAGQHLVEHHAEREDVGPVIRGHAAHLLGRHVAERAEHHPGQRLRRRARPWEAPTSAERTGSACVSFARPKSRIFTRPSAATKTLSGFRSRCTIPLSCAADRPCAI
jgi:hypothetical protein